MILITEASKSFGLEETYRDGLRFPNAFGRNLVMNLQQALHKFGALGSRIWKESCVTLFLQ